MQHEIQFRGQDYLDKIEDFGKIVVCGAGSLGSILTESLVRHGFSFIDIIDNDSVEESNICGSSYRFDDIGSHKVNAIASIAMDINPDCILHTKHKLIEDRNIKKLFKHASLVVDCLDNIKGRKVISDFCRENSLECLHVGVTTGYAESVWQEDYKVPPKENSDEDPCDIPLARNTASIICSVACEQIIRLSTEGHKIKSVCFTHNDMKISPYR